MKSYSFKAFLAAALVALMPSLANANSIDISGTATTTTQSTPFSVTTGGSFSFYTTSFGTFLVAVTTSAGGSGNGAGIFGDFNLDLGAGNYFLNVTSLCCSWDYTTTISSRNGVVAAGATSVPEPGSLILIGSGLLGLGLLRRRRAQQAA